MENRSRSSANGSQTHFTEGEAPSVAWPSEAVRVGGESIAIIQNGSQTHLTEGELPSVAWPSEAVRVGVESIAIIQNGSQTHFTGHSNPGRRFALPWAITLRPVGAKNQ